jgi:hypothetical protein
MRDKEDNGIAQNKVQFSLTLEQNFLPLFPKVFLIHHIIEVIYLYQRFPQNLALMSSTHIRRIVLTNDGICLKRS